MSSRAQSRDLSTRQPNFTFSIEHYPATGRREYTTDVLMYVGRYGWIWASTVSGTRAYYLDFGNNRIYPSSSNYRAEGNQVRCLRE